MYFVINQFSMPVYNRISRNGVGLRRICIRAYSTTNYQSDEYQYLERSNLPTNHFQASLTRLPIPDLDKTCDRYLRSIRPLLKQSQFENTEKIVAEFKQNEGIELQTALRDFDKQNMHTSYISKPWFDMYLSSRLPIIINFNPFLTFSPDPKEEFNDQLTRATNLCISVGRFKKALDKEYLSPEVFYMNPKTKSSPWFQTICKALPEKFAIYGAYAFKAFPLDMSQHPSLFNTTRIPKIGMDVLEQNVGMRHILVMRKGNMFAVDLFDENGLLVDPHELKRRLASVLNADLKTVQHPLGALTSLPRDEWANIRNRIVESSAQNTRAMQMIDGAVFCLCLDEIKSTEPTRLIKSMLHGDDGTNRWFDKSFTINVHGDGMSAINFEHSWGDGVAVLRLMEDINRDSTTNHWATPGQDQTPHQDNTVNKIELNLDDSLKQEISTAKEKMKVLCDSLEFSTLEYFKMNRDFIKKQKISPDALMQLAIQIAYNGMNNEMVPTYESCSTAIFKHGRTETMRPATSDMKRCVQAFLAKEQPTQLRLLMNAMSKTHFQLVKEASMGQGFDRHLMGLRMTAERLGRPLPKVFQDPTYAHVTHFILSTSTLSTETVALGGFGPVVQDGYGIGYNVAKSKLGYTLSTYKHKRSATDMAQAIEHSLDQIYDALSKTSPA